MEVESADVGERASDLASGWQDHSTGEFDGCIRKSWRMIRWVGISIAFTCPFMGIGRKANQQIGKAWNLSVLELTAIVAESHRRAYG